MMKETYHLSITETQIMEKLWFQTEPIKQTQLLAMFNEEGKEWGRQTLNTLLIRLEMRGFVKREKRFVQAAYTKKEIGELIIKEAANNYMKSDIKMGIIDFVCNTNDDKILEKVADYIKKYE